jgi:Holliday junction resolvasome RuvABC endonuclease subunit
MTAVLSPRSLIFAVHPTSRGFGWVAFEGPFAPFDWALVKARGDKNAICLRKLEGLIERLAPETLVLEAFGPRTSSRSDRIARLCKALVAHAMNRGIEVVIYTRGDIRACFASVGARTRDEIAAAVVRQIDAFRHLLPKKRRAWESEDRRMAIFSAAALVITHFHYGSGRLFDNLSDAI